MRVEIGPPHLYDQHLLLSAQFGDGVQCAVVMASSGMGVVDPWALYAVRRSVMSVVANFTPSHFFRRRPLGQGVDF